MRRTAAAIFEGVGSDGRIPTSKAEGVHGGFHDGLVVEKLSRPADLLGRPLAGGDRGDGEAEHLGQAVVAGDVPADGEGQRSEGALPATEEVAKAHGWGGVERLWRCVAGAPDRGGGLGGRCGVEPPLVQTGGPQVLAEPIGVRLDLHDGDVGGVQGAEASQSVWKKSGLDGPPRKSREWIHSR
jgi:hypothetical protein